MLVQTVIFLLYQVSLFCVIHGVLTYFFLSSQPQSDGYSRRRQADSVSEAPITRIPIFLQGSAVPPNIMLAGTSTIDEYARILFPLAFGIFNLIYWYIYLSKDTLEKPRSVLTPLQFLVFSVHLCVLSLSNKGGNH